MPGPFESKTGTYTGNGTTQTITLGYSPSLVMIINETDGDSVALKLAGSAAATCIAITTAVAAVAANGVTNISNGFTVGSDSSVNENAKVFRYIAFRNS